MYTKGRRHKEILKHRRLSIYQKEILKYRRLSIYQRKKFLNIVACQFIRADLSVFYRALKNANNVDRFWIPAKNVEYEIQQRLMGKSANIEEHKLNKIFGWRPSKDTFLISCKEGARRKDKRQLRGYVELLDNDIVLKLVWQLTEWEI
jgi:hypothetical protein